MVHNFSKSIAFILPVFLLVSCNITGIFQQEGGDDDAGYTELNTTENDGVTSAEVDANSGELLYMEVGTDSAIFGASLQIPAGALSGNTMISLQQGASVITSTLQDNLGIDSGNGIQASGPAVILSSSIAMDATDLVLSIPLDGASSLRLLADPNAKLIVIYKIKSEKDDGNLKLGVILRNKLIVENNIVRFKTSHFGAFQAAVSDKLIADPVAEVTTTDPIKNISGEEVIGSDTDDGISDVGVTLSYDWSFSSSSDYTFNSASLEFSSGAVSLVEINQVDDTSATGFLAGTLADTEVSSSALRLTTGGASSTTGFFTSQIFDAISSTSWTKIAWQPAAPYSKPLPNGGEVESDYTSGNVDMSSNVLLLHMEESSGTTITDDSGNGLDFSSFNSPTLGAPGVMGSSALTFDGTDDYLQLAHDSSVDFGPSQPSTVVAWVYQPTLVNFSPIIALRQSGSSTVSYMYDIDSLGYLRSYNSVSRVSAGTISASTWHHVAFVYDGANIMFYIDGTLDSSHVQGRSNVTGPIRIGWDNGSNFFGGTIDELAIFDTALSSSQIAAIAARADHDILFQVRSCDDSSCSGETFLGPDGSGSSYYSELENYSADLPVIDLDPSNIGHVSNNRYFQYNIIINSGSTNTALTEVKIGPHHYNSTSPYLTNKTGRSFSLIEEFNVATGGGHSADLYFQISHDGSNWYYHNGSKWAKVTSGAVVSQANTGTQISSHVETYVKDVAAGKFFFRVIFDSDGTQQAELKTISIKYQ